MSYVTCIESFTLTGVNFCGHHGFNPTMDKGESYFSLHDSFHARIAAPPTKEGELRVHHYQDGLVGNPFSPNPQGELYQGHSLTVEEQYEAWFLGSADAEFYYSPTVLEKIKQYVK